MRSITAVLVVAVASAPRRMVAGLTPPARGHGARPRSLARAAAEPSAPMSLDDLEALENAARPPVLGRECATYRWTQDAASVRVEAPLPFRPPASDVSVVVGERTFDAAVVNSGVEIRGELGGAADPARTGWEIEEDALVLTIAKAAPDVFWPAFLVSEVPAPTARYRGSDGAAAFVQTRDALNVAVDLPDGATAADLVVSLDADRWRVSGPGGWSAGGALWGTIAARDAAWLVDDGRLHLSLPKVVDAWWPGLTRDDRGADE